jgi:Head domain of trimeric autotransporter adhesin
MNTRYSIRKASRQSAIWAISLIVLTAMSGYSQQANLAISNTLKVEASSSMSRLELRGNGILLGRGNSTQNNLSQSELIPTSPLLMWNPWTSAFRAGFFGSDVQYIGTSSTAFGYYSYAPGFGAFAAGRGSASGDYTVAIGSNVQAIGTGSVALGMSTVAFQPGSFAMGYSSYASGTYSVATGLQTQAVGNYSFASNQQTVATGSAATAFGISTRADTLGSLAIGQYNVGAAATGGATVWRTTDPVFEIGNGTGSGSSQRSNAFTVYKNGTADLGGQPRAYASKFRAEI